MSTFNQLIFSSLKKCYLHFAIMQFSRKRFAQLQYIIRCERFSLTGNYGHKALMCFPCEKLLVKADSLESIQSSFIKNTQIVVAARRLLS